MSKPKKRKSRKVKGKIKITQSATLVHKSDKTRVARPDTIMLKKAPTQTILPNNAATFKVKIRKK